MSRSHGLFDVVAGGLHPRRSVFDLSYSKSFDATFGLLYPVMCDEVVPGDTFKIGNKIVVRMANPLMAPILDNWDVYVHYFFVPYRLLDKNFEEFITGGINGDSTVTPLTLDLSYVNASGFSNEAYKTVGSLGDLLGFCPKPGLNRTIKVSQFPSLAYYSVWNEFYRDETLQKPAVLSGVSAVFDTSRCPLYDKYSSSDLTSFTSVGGYRGLLRRSWKKDYFTSALPFQQRGKSPELPFNISGYGNVELIDTSTSGRKELLASASGASMGALSDVSSFKASGVGPSGVTQKPLGVNFSDSVVSTFNIADLRLAWQIQKWMERNARSGVRYTEFLGAHFGVAPKDERLQRPEYLGGSKQSIIISEVLQTSASNSQPTPQGNMAGHGLSVGSSFCCDYTASEFGLIIGLLSVMPEANYHQGINRQWMRETKFDYFFPEFVGLSEQEIKNEEIYFDSTNPTNPNFGFQGRYDEMRFKPNMVCGQLRPGNNNYYDYWTLTRSFTSQPTLSSEFINCNPDISGVFSVADENPFVINVGNIIKAIRPIPALAEPGLVDHF